MATQYNLTNNANALDNVTLQVGDTIVCGPIPTYGIYYRQITLSQGEYKLECWGSKGGNIRSNNVSVAGGNGGYATGTLTLSQSTILYLFPGAVGQNGGGSGKNYGYNKGASGGGASDIRIRTDSLYARVIVAGGGGGAFYNSSITNADNQEGGYSAGLTLNLYGANGKNTRGGTSESHSSVQTTKGAFGNGGIATNIGNAAAGGGGGGWYGGAASGYTWNSQRTYGGGGGSNYVYTEDTASYYPAECQLNSSYYLTDTEVKSGDDSFLSPLGNSEDGHNDTGYIKITVSKLKTQLTPPTNNGTTLIYTGNSISATSALAGFDSDTMEITSGTSSAINADSYTVYIGLKNTNQYEWTDGTTGNKSVSWEISKRTIAIPTATAEKNYTGNYYGSISPYSDIINNFDSDWMTIAPVGTETIAQCNAGSYTVRFQLNSTINLQWNDTNHTTTDKDVTWTINRQVISPQPIGKSVTYTGSTYGTSAGYSDILNDFDSTKMTIAGGSTSGVNAGSYTVSIAANSNYCWDSNESNPSVNQTPLSVTWIINRANSYVAPISSNNKLFLGKDIILYVSYFGDGNTANVSSSDTSIFTASCSKENDYIAVTIHPVSTGTATLSVTINQGTNYAEATSSVSLTVSVNPNGNKINISDLSENESMLFWYTGREESIVIPKKYTVKIECWGAAGGRGDYPGNAMAGGYISGILPANLENNRTLYLHIGGMGSHLIGGWNGGGGSAPLINNKDSGSGGGATDITLTSSTFSYENYVFKQTTNNYNNRLIVAGGGSGGTIQSPISGANAQFQAQAYGGYGFDNETGYDYAGSLINTGTASNTNQLSAGGFGYGATANNAGSSSEISGAGGGWYGGAIRNNQTSGGGSSFIWSDETIPLSNDVKFSDCVPQNYFINSSEKMTNFTQQKGGSNQPNPLSTNQVGGNLYNGYIRITVVEIITFIQITKPSNGSILFDNQIHTYDEVLNNFDSNYMEITDNGITTASQIGEYTLTIGLKNKILYCWDDDTQNDITVTWAIHGAIAAIPTGGQLYYTGQPRNYILYNYDSDTMTIDISNSTRTATDVGNYIIRVLPIANYEWPDGTMSGKDIVWRIVSRPNNLHSSIKVPITENGITTNEIKSILGIYVKTSNGWKESNATFIKTHSGWHEIL